MIPSRAYGLDAAAIVAGQWWVLRDDGVVNATVRILEDDPEVWDDLVAPASGDALYVHGLMVRRLHRGRGFVERGERTVAGPWGTLVRFEKALA
ncbi:hypothetical protein [Mumia zhuanghuii]|uniref:Uncharacterized protein n=1 Tax=Mumia zhuanghuii TaxID=2585211 RepID=A0A5C4MMX6_9ACTN|nr:hypothetical protein [Mumia zhuanghuii]TNC46466.1 hypothetical protein FHE65_12595 [Mumia zhuanghuii]TNC47150.1 hypothetical protein FHE65_11080 [Mumia zhuanghuii]